ncbi:hypothetical protein [Chitinophaga vietnamensis]|uniref:hypothetical protein n=1 Tax=Chitinophaga vietnamensis TaxID=2593957 RepID=UPI0011789998|nr:hypothetical protein [Chitinophaga vietnamensis]
MKRIFLLALCAFTMAASAQSYVSPAHIGFVYPLSSNGKNAALYTNHFSLHVLAGVSKAETGSAVAGIANIVKDSATGAQIAGFSNFINRTSHAATVAGFMNSIRTSSDGAVVSGFMNLTGHQANGAQVTGFLNNAATLNGVQVAGFMNMAKDAAGSTQVAGFMNKAGDVSVQVGGFLNVAKKVKGVQVGFINISDSCDYPIGVVNITKHGEKQISVSVDETANIIAAFRSGGKFMYGILGAGYNVQYSGESLYALQAGIGWHIPLSAHFRLNAEAYQTVLTDFKKDPYGKWSLGIFPAYRFGTRIEVFAGPTFNIIHTKNGLGEDLMKHYLWTNRHGIDNNKFEAGYFGGQAGVQIRL